MRLWASGQRFRAHRGSKDWLIQMAKWEGETDNEKWTLIVEIDCFDDDEPFVVVLDAKQESERIGSVLLLLTPEQAREVANTLLREADSAELQTERVRQYQQENS